MNKDKEEYYCIISGQIFADPVVASDGDTYERESLMQWKTKNATSPNTREILTDTLFDNKDKKRAVLAYLAQHPELYEEDKVFLPNSFKLELIDAIAQSDCNKIDVVLGKDPRLITTALNAAGDTAFILSCSQKSLNVFKLILKNLFAKSPDTSRELVFKNITLILKNLHVAGLEAYCDVAGIDRDQFFKDIAIKTPQLAKEIEVQRQRAALAPFIEPLTAQIANLSDRCQAVERENSILKQQLAAMNLTLQQTLQAVAELQVKQQQQQPLAVSKAVASAHDQKLQKLNTPVKTPSNIPLIKDALIIAPNILVYAVSLADQNDVSQINIINLKNSRENRVISLQEYPGQSGFSMLLYDKNRFLYCINFVSKPSIIGLIDCFLKNNSRTVNLKYSDVNILTLTPPKNILAFGEVYFNCKHKDNMEYGTLNLENGFSKLTPSDHPKLMSKSITTSISDAPEIVYVDNATANARAIRYDYVTHKESVLLDDAKSKASLKMPITLFKNIGCNIISIANMSTKREEIELKLFDIDAGHITHTFKLPEPDSDSNETCLGFTDVCYSENNSLSAIFHDPSLNDGKGSMLVKWDLKTSEIIYCAPVEGEALSIYYDFSGTLYCVTDKAVLLYTSKSMTVTKQFMPDGNEATKNTTGPRTF